MLELKTYPKNSLSNEEVDFKLTAEFIHSRATWKVYFKLFVIFGAG